MFRFTEGFIRAWIPVGLKARDIYKPRLHLRINPKGNVTVPMAVKREGESWRKILGKFPNNKLDKQQRDTLNSVYRKWFLVLEDESVLPKDIYDKARREEEKLHERLTNEEIDRAEGKGRVSDLIVDFLDRHVSTLKTADQVEHIFTRGEFAWDNPITPSCLWMAPLEGGGPLRQLH